MKYKPNIQMTPAVYSSGGSRNPVVEALPEILSVAEFHEAVQNFPPVPVNRADMTYRERMRKMAQVQTVFVPLDYMYTVYESLFRMMQSSGRHSCRASLTSIRLLNSITFPAIMTIS